MKRTINFEWYTDDFDFDLRDYKDDLNSHAIDHATEMVKDGFICGELLYTIYDPDSDTDVMVDGWWWLD